jgi:hypothetical protein
MAHRDQQQMAQLFRIGRIGPCPVQPQPAFLHSILRQMAVLQNFICQCTQAAIILHQCLLQGICREHSLLPPFSFIQKGLSLL